MHRQELVRYLDEYLDIHATPDASLNGLQVEGKDMVQTLGLAVDACEAVFSLALQEKVDFLIVHHGLFWGSPEPLTGGRYRRIKLLVENGINLYAAHLPLDRHAEVGNAVQLARLLDLQVTAPFGEIQGVPVGYEATADPEISIDDLASRVRDRLNLDARIDAFGPASISRVGIVTGSGTSLLPEALAKGLDAFITGEPRHSSYHTTREEGIHCIYAGHYCTETLGVQALGGHLKREFNLSTHFLSFPTGL